jgi:hypothetical protein
MSRRAKFALGIGVVLLSVALLIVPLGIVILPTAASFFGYRTVGLSISPAGLYVLILMSIVGGAACVAGILLISANKNK